MFYIIMRFYIGICHQFLQYFTEETVSIGRELFLLAKAMVPYVQLSTNCRIGF